MTNITDKPPKEQEDWLVKKGSELKNEEDKEDNAIMRQAKILYEVWSLWSVEHNQKNECISTEAKWAWGYDFYKWARAYTKRRAGKEPANTTIDNKITIYRDYIAQEIIEAPETVFIPKRDEFGNQEDKNLIDENTWCEVPVDFSKIDYGKLLVARGSARRREMSPEAWSVLVDPYGTVGDLKEALGQSKPNTQDEEKENSFYIFEQDGIIYGCMGGVVKPVMQVLFENDEGDELFSKTLCRILKAVGANVPLEYQK